MALENFFPSNKTAVDFTEGDQGTVNFTKQTLADDKHESFRKETLLAEQLDHFKQKIADLEQKIKNQAELTQDELLLLYEMDKQADFTYQPDPKLIKLRTGRDANQDLEIMVGDASKIARKSEDVTEHTTVYVGAAFPDMFATLAHVESIYLGTFPEDRFRKRDIKSGGKSVEKLTRLIREQDMNVSEGSYDVMTGTDQSGRPMFVTSETEKRVTLGMATLRQLGFTDPDNRPAMNGVIKAISIFGGFILPAEVGPSLRADSPHQVVEQDWTVMTQPLAASNNGSHGLFHVGHYDNGCWLDIDYSDTYHTWDLDRQVVFGLREGNTKTETA